MKQVPVPHVFLFLFRFFIKILAILTNHEGMNYFFTKNLKISRFAAGVKTFIIYNLEFNGGLAVPFVVDGDVKAE